jgi:putative Ca2+/H+ antiporter (TMEM165/GDT1 family)
LRTTGSYLRKLIFSVCVARVLLGHVEEAGVGGADELDLDGCRLGHRVLAALAGNSLAALAGAWIAETINIRAMTLLTAMALLFAGASGLIRRRPPKAQPPKRLLLPAAFILLLAAELGDRTQFLTFALAGRFDSAPLAAAGATLGMVAGCMPAVLLGDRFATSVPVRAIRYGVAALFLIAGFITAVNALQLT